MSEAAQGGAAAPAASPAPSPTPAPAAPPAGAPAPSPAPAPAPAAPLNVGGPGAPQEAPQEIVVYEPTGNVVLDLSLAYVGERGFGPDHPAMKAASSGDFAPLSDALKALGDKAKGYERYVKAAETAFKETAAKKAAEVQAGTAAVHSAVGGADTWSAIEAWAKKEASDEEKAEINKALAAGGLAAVAVARQMKDAFEKAGSPGVKARSALKEGAGGAAKESGALSPTEYKEELAKLTAKYGAGRAGHVPEFAELRARRQMFQGA